MKQAKGRNAPFGKGVREAFDSFIRIARRLGFHVRDLDGYALDAQIGTGDEYILVFWDIWMSLRRKDKKAGKRSFCYEKRR